MNMRLDTFRDPITINEQHRFIEQERLARVSLFRNRLYAGPGVEDHQYRYHNLEGGIQNKQMLVSIARIQHAIIGSELPLCHEIGNLPAAYFDFNLTSSKKYKVDIVAAICPSIYIGERVRRYNKMVYDATCKLLTAANAEFYNIEFSVILKNTWENPFLNEIDQDL